MDVVCRRIALVTRQFASLRGLQSVALGVWLLALVLQSQVPLLHSAQARFGLLSTSLLVTLVLIRAYYAQRFGRVEVQEDNGFWWFLWITITAALVDTITSGRGVPSAFFFTVAALSAGTVIRDWPFRSHYLLLAVAALFSSLTFAGVIDDASRRLWVRHAIEAIGGALIVTGLLDHYLLVTTLRQKYNDAHTL